MRMKKGVSDPQRRFEVAPGQTRRSGQRPKRAVNLSVDAELLKVAKEMNVNLSRALERALDELTAEERAKRFYEENKISIDAYNAYIERHGTLAEQYHGRNAFDDPAV